MGGENLSGGAANGMPKNWLTVAVADGIEVVVPITMPDARVTSGRKCVALTTKMADNATAILYGVNIAVYEYEEEVSKTK